MLATLNPVYSQKSVQLQGAWQNEEGVYLFTDGFYSYTAFSPEAFGGTTGGAFEVSNGKLVLQPEFNTFDPQKVGSSASESLDLKGKNLTIGGKKFDRVDDGSPGELQGAWLFSGRKQEDGSISERAVDGPRKTMKLLSGKRFQWIAYNSETKEFMGTGGGTYTTKDGKYTENIDFFSRDQSRVGASLPFEYDLRDGKWHHQGKSSKGDPIYEVWVQRQD